MGIFYLDFVQGLQDRGEQKRFLHTFIRKIQLCQLYKFFSEKTETIYI